MILPTGGGKSVIFMTSAWIEKELTTVMIVPFITLIEEMEKRCKELGLSCYIWRNSGTILSQRMAQIVLVRCRKCSDIRVSTIFDSIGAGSEVGTDCDR